MYLYFDKKGVLKEVISSDSTIRIGNADTNVIFAYFEKDEVILNVGFLMEGWSVEKYEESTEIAQIPSDEKRDLKYFKEFKDYKFHILTLTSEDLVGVSGLRKLTIRGLGTNGAIYANGVAILNIEENIIQKDDVISKNQYDYLINYVGTNFTNKKYVDDQNALQDTDIKTARLQGIANYEKTLGGGVITDTLTRYSNDTLTKSVDLKNEFYLKEEINATTNQIVEDVSQNATDIADIKNNLISQENPVGSFSGETLPNDTQLSDFIFSVETRIPHLGDVIIFTLELATATDENYKYFFTKEGWKHYLIPGVEKAQNGVLGIIKGNFGQVGSDGHFSVEIIDGEIKHIYTKNADNKWLDLTNRLNANELKLTSVVDGRIVVKNAEIAVKDNNQNVISGTYAKVGTSYTKGEADNRYLPRTYADLYFYSKDGLVDEVPLDEVQFSKSVESNVVANLFEITRSLVGTYEFNKTSGDNNQIFVRTNKDTSATLELKTKINDTTLNIQEVGTTFFKANVPTLITISNNYLYLGATQLATQVGDILSKSLNIKCDIMCEVEVLSNTQYASTFQLNTQSINIDVNKLSGFKEFIILPTDFTLNDKGLYETILPRSVHEEPQGFLYNIQFFKEINDTQRKQVIGDYEINSNGDITIYTLTPFKLFVYVAV